MLDNAGIGIRAYHGSIDRMERAINLLLDVSSNALADTSPAMLGGQSNVLMPLSSSTRNPSQSGSPALEKFAKVGASGSCTRP